MADVDAAIRYSLGFEDAALTGAITFDPKDHGGDTRFGIARRFHPELNASTYYSSMGRTPALALAYEIYREQYAAPLNIQHLGSQEIANKLLSLGINIGIEAAAKILQRATGVNDDGHIGVQTIMAADTDYAAQVVDRMRDAAKSYYLQLVAHDPSQQRFLAGWLARAAA